MSRYGEQLSIPRVGIVILSCLLAGCTGSSEGRGRIHGKVSIAGKPLATGQIRLFPLSGGPGDMKDEVVEDLPAKFNSQSTLQIDYDPANKQSYDFDL
jgi:hypothetical protein